MNVFRDRPFNLQGGGGGYGFFTFRNFFFGQHELEYLFFLSRRDFFFLEFNIRLYDKNSEADYFFFLHQNQNIFSATLGIRIFFSEKKTYPTHPFKLNDRSLRKA